MEDKNNILKYILPGFISGCSELLLFHPLDTIGKRIMNDNKNARFTNLYKGIGYAGIYRVPQRMYKFSMQPIICDYIKNINGEHNKIVNSFISGGIVGFTETIMIPLDILKIKSQTNNLNEGLIVFLRNNPFGLFKGAGYSALRGTISSSCLFGIKAISDDVNDDKSKIKKHMIGSTCAGITAVFFASPFDVLKTRAQTGTYKNHIFRELIKREGIGGLFLGIVPKTIVISPKLIFSFFIASYIQDILI